jgi:hypothetical protein
MKDKGVKLQETENLPEGHGFGGGKNHEPVSM